MREPLSIGQLPAPARGQPGSTSPQATTAEPPIPEFGGNIGENSKMLYLWEMGPFFKKMFCIEIKVRSTMSLFGNFGID